MPVRFLVEAEPAGELLMTQLIDYLRQHGTQRLVATVLSENTRMLQLARELGFHEEPHRHEPGTRWIELPLNP